jgi:hypothetical protein
MEFSNNNCYLLFWSFQLCKIINKSLLGRYIEICTKNARKIKMILRKHMEVSLIKWQATKYEDRFQLQVFLTVISHFGDEFMIIRHLLVFAN